MSPTEPRLSVLFAAPTYWPALAFGGPIWMARELNEGMITRGHCVEVVTTSLVDLANRGALRTTTRSIGGATVHYLATPLRYRWMGITPTLPIELGRIRRPDVAHVFGYRDVVTTGVATWCRRRGIPYVFEPLGMFKPKLRKVGLKRIFDATIVRNVAAGAASVIATSRFESDEIVEAGVPRERVILRGNGFPEPNSTERRERPRELRARLGIPEHDRILLYVGRIAAGKGIEFLLAATRALPETHLVLAGADDRHGVIDAVRRAQADPATAGRVHMLGSTSDERPFDLYAQADVFVLPSAGESFGMVAAEAASCGTPVVVTDRCGVAESLVPDGAFVVPYDATAITAAIETVLHDPELAGRLAAGGIEAARTHSWKRIVEVQEQIYLEAVAEAGSSRRFG